MAGSSAEPAGVRASLAAIRCLDYRHRALYGYKRVGDYVVGRKATITPKIAALEQLQERAETATFRELLEVSGRADPWTPEKALDTLV